MDEALDEPLDELSSKVAVPTSRSPRNDPPTEFGGGSAALVAGIAEGFEAACAATASNLELLALLLSDTVLGTGGRGGAGFLSRGP